MDAQPAPSIEEQIAAVEDARDFHARSAQWRAARRGFNRQRHARQVACLEAAIGTLKAGKAERDELLALVRDPRHSGARRG